MKRAQQSMTFLVRSSLFIAATTLVVGCDDCGPQTGVQQLQQELSTTCVFQKAAGVQRLTKNAASSTQPTIHEHGDGHVFAWVDDRVIPAAIFVQRLDPLGATLGRPLRITTTEGVSRPRIASTGKILVLAFVESTEAQTVVKAQVFNAKMQPQLAEPRIVAPTDESHSPGLALVKGQFVIALGREKQLDLHELALSPGGAANDPTVGQQGDGGASSSDGGSRSTGDNVAVSVTTRTLQLGDDVHPLGSVDLLHFEDQLFLTADHPEGWSIQIVEIGRDSVRKIAQVIDDRRNPDSRWCCPAIGPAGSGHLALFWQGPSMGLSALYFMEFDLEGAPVGTERPFEAIVRDDEERAIGRAPAFHPALARTPGGLVAAFADNRYANSEILLAAFGCGGQR